jgi:hypothetical protein
MIREGSTVRVGRFLGTVDYIARGGKRALVCFADESSAVYPLASLLEVEDVEDGPDEDEDEGGEREGCAFEDPDTFADEDSAPASFDDEACHGDEHDDDVNEGPFAYYSDGF